MQLIHGKYSTHTHTHLILVAIFQLILGYPVAHLKIRDVEASFLPTQQHQRNKELTDISFTGDRMPGLPPNQRCHCIKGTW